MFPFTNGKDDDSILADIILNMGTPYCDWAKGTSGPTECWIGVGGNGLVPKLPLADYAPIA
jgi:hypothetical protein